MATNDTFERLKQYTNRMENLLNEIDGLKDDLKDLKAEIRGQGFNVQALTKLVAIRRKDNADKETELLNDLLLYAQATGTQLNLDFPEPTPLEQAIDRVGKDRLVLSQS